MSEFAAIGEVDAESATGKEKGVIFPKLSYSIMGAVFEVHNQLGPGFTEDIYEQALTFELEARGIGFERQKPIQVYYKGQFAGNYRLDLLVEDKIIVELKAVSALNDLFKRQVVSYLRAAGLRLGILVNFGAAQVQYIRVVNSRTAPTPAVEP
jgi:GxxExxY protein